MRLKIIAGNLLAVLVVGALCYFVTKSQIDAVLLASNDAALANDMTLFVRGFRYAGGELAQLAEEQAATSEFRSVFTSVDINSRRVRAREAADRAATWFADPARRGQAPIAVLVTDERGHVLARNGDPNRMFDRPLADKISGLPQALQGAAGGYALWSEHPAGDDWANKTFITAYAPIRSDVGAVLGAIVVAYDISTEYLRHEAALLGPASAVAIIAGNAVYASDYATGIPVQQSLQTYVAGEGAAVARAATTARSEPARFRLSIAGNEYKAIIGHLYGAATVVIVASPAIATAPTSAFTSVALFSLLGVLGVLVYGFLIGSGFLRPIEQMEEEILAVINGDTAKRLATDSPEFGGLAYRVNQLLNVLTGVQEEEDDDAPRSGGNPASFGEPGTAPAAPAVSGGASGGGAGGADYIDDPAVAAKLEAEPADAYYARIYREYVAAKQAAGENVANIPEDKFTQRLKGSETHQAQKYSVRAVRFVVQSGGVLKPVLLR